MNFRFTPHLIWTALAILAYALGYLSEDTGAAKRSNASGAASPKEATTAGDQTSRALSAGLAKSKDARAEAADSEQQARIRMFELLTEPDHIQRLRDICDFIPSITKDNWRGVLDAFAVQRRTMGRRYNSSPELDMIAERIGEVAGLDALKTFVNAQTSNENEIALHLMKGWSRSDVKAAVEWYRQLPLKQQMQQMRDPLLSAYAKVDPAQALEIVFHGNEASQNGGVGRVVYSALESRGFAEAEDLLTKAAGRADISDATKGSMFYVLALQKAQESADPFAALDWYSQYAGKPYVGPTATYSVVSTAANSDPVKVVGWLDSSTLTDPQQKAAESALVGAWRKKDANGLAGWLTANQDGPGHDRLAAEAARQTSFGDGSVEDAQRWLQLITDPATRAKVAVDIIHVPSVKPGSRPGTP